MKTIKQSSIHPADQFTLAFRVTLSEVHRNEWATHLESCNDDVWSKHWGHYFSDKELAESDYLKRCAEDRLNPQPRTQS